jgi:hypothetical protein
MVMPSRDSRAGQQGTLLAVEQQQGRARSIWSAGCCWVTACWYAWQGRVECGTVDCIQAAAGLGRSSRDALNVVQRDVVLEGEEFLLGRAGQGRAQGRAQQGTAGHRAHGTWHSRAQQGTGLAIHSVRMFMQ